MSTTAASSLATRPTGLTADDRLDLIELADMSVVTGRAALREWLARFQSVFYDKRQLVTNRQLGSMIWGSATFTDDVVKRDARWRVARATRHFDPNNPDRPEKYLFAGAS